MFFQTLYPNYRLVPFFGFRFKILIIVTITEHFSGEVFGGISFFLSLVFLPTNK